MPQRPYQNQLVVLPALIREAVMRRVAFSWRNLLLMCVFGLSASARAATVKLAWDPSPEPDIAVYSLYYGRERGSYPAKVSAGTQTAITLENLTVGNYYCTVTASNEAGLESAPSNEISFPFPLDAPSVVGVADGESFNAGTVIKLQLSTSSTVFDRTEIIVDGEVAADLGPNEHSGAWMTPSPGNHVVTVRSYDSRGNAVTTGPLCVQVVEPTLKPTAWSSTEGFRFTVTGAPGRRQQIFTSSDLQHWELLDTPTNSSGTIVLNDDAAAQERQRFYRVVSE